ncbi:MAG: T9SS type A sorting domain-containing protein [Flavobacteriales bacterium]|nr:T9SS type A sorting domain-containing protein [Flavobacteriales bacterium]
MKRLTTLLLFLASIGSASAQNWAPFPLDETSEWRVHRQYPVSGMYPSGGHYQCTVQEEYSYSVADTVEAGGHSYLRFSVSGMTNRTGNYGCLFTMEPVSFVQPTLLRTEGGIYYRKSGSSPETVYADFNQVVGDTVPGLWYVIDSVDQVNINGHNCVRQWISNGPNGVAGVWLIEAVGSNHGTMLHEGLSHSQQNISVCYREFGQPVLVNDEDVFACSITDVEQFGLGKEAMISPNPSSGIFRMETSQASSYRVYDLFGRIITQGHLNGTSELDITSQPNGIYLISVENENGISTSKLVKQ